MDDFVNGTPPLNLTGYSLGGHLASSFTLMHSDDVTATWTFNASGLGGILNAAGQNLPPTGADIRMLIKFYDLLMDYDKENADPSLLSHRLWSELAANSPYLNELDKAVQEARNTMKAA